MLFLILMGEYRVSAAAQPRPALLLGSEGAEHSRGLFASQLLWVWTHGYVSNATGNKIFTVATTELNLTLKAYCQVLTSGS